MSSPIARNILAFVFGFLVFTLLGGAVYYYRQSVNEKELLRPLPIEEIIPPIDDTPSHDISSTTNSTSTISSSTTTKISTSTASTTE